MYKPENISETLKRPHLVLVRTRHQLPKSLADISSCFVDRFTRFLHAFGLAHENLHKNQRFSRTVTKKNTASAVQSPLPSPSPAQQAAPVTQAVLFATGWNYCPPRETTKLFRRALYRKNTHKGYCWTAGTHFLRFVSYDTWNGVFLGRK